MSEAIQTTDVAENIRFIWSTFNNVRTNFYFTPMVWGGVVDTAPIDPHREDVAFGRYFSELLAYVPPFDQPTDDDVSPRTGFVFPE
jgi:hypothetical protein